MKKYYLLLLRTLIILLVHTTYSYSQHTIPKTGYIEKETFDYFKKNNPDLDSLGYKIDESKIMIEVNNNQFMEIFNKYLAAKVSVPYEKKDTKFLDIYKEVVYRTNLTSKKENKLKMRFWKDTIKVYFNKLIPKNQQDSLMNFAYKLSKEVDSLNVKQVYNKDDSNYFIYYINQKQDSNYDESIPENSGYYLYWKNNYIYDAKIQHDLSTQKNEEVFNIALLKYYFFNSLGHFSYSDKVEPKSYLSKSNKLRELTEIDLEILKYHYSYGSFKRVDLKTFEEHHKKMKMQLEKNSNQFILHNSQ